LSFEETARILGAHCLVHAYVYHERAPFYYDFLNDERYQVNLGTLGTVVLVKRALEKCTHPSEALYTL